mgnify:FL=1
MDPEKMVLTTSTIPGLNSRTSVEVEGKSSVPQIIHDRESKTDQECSQISSEDSSTDQISKGAILLNGNSIN